MNSQTKAILVFSGLFFLLMVSVHCNNSTIELQKEKTKQLQIIQSIQMYRLDNDLPIKIKEQKLI